MGYRPGRRAGGHLPHPHPDTTVVSNDLDINAGGHRPAGPHPVAVFVDPDTRDIAVYLRKIGGDPDGPSASEAVFRVNGDGAVIDLETGSVWDVGRGIATEGVLKGAVLQQIPYVTAFDWAWLDFFPHTSFYDSEDPKPG